MRKLKLNNGSPFLDKLNELESWFFNKFSFLTTKKSYVFDGSYEQFSEHLKQLDGSYSIELYKSKLVITSHFSFGTLTSNNNGYIDKPKIVANVESISSNQQQINLLLKPSDTSIFATIFGLIIFLITLNLNAHILVLIFALIIPFWFTWIYNIQRNHLIKSITESLRLRKKDI